MYLDNFRNEKEEITRVPTSSADRMNIDRRGSRGDSLNKPAQLEKIKTKALEYMSKLEAAPGETSLMPCELNECRHSQCLVQTYVSCGNKYGQLLCLYDAQLLMCTVWIDRQ